MSKVVPQQKHSPAAKYVQCATEKRPMHTFPRGMTETQKTQTQILAH